MGNRVYAGRRDRRGRVSRGIRLRSPDPYGPLRPVVHRVFSTTVHLPSVRDLTPLQNRSAANRSVLSIDITHAVAHFRTPDEVRVFCGTRRGDQPATGRIEFGELLARLRAQRLARTFTIH